MASTVTRNVAIAAGIVGLILLFCGIGSCVCGFIWIGFGGGAHGIWSGIGLLLVGSFGVAILITKSKPVMVFFLVFCIIDLIINAIQAIIAAIVVALLGLLKDAFEKNECVEYNGKCSCQTAGNARNTGYEFKCGDIDTMIAIFNAITAFSVLGIIGTFTGSIIGCIGSCCDKGSDQPGVVIIQQGNPAQGNPQVQTTTVQTSFQQQPNNPTYPMNNPGAYPMNAVYTNPAVQPAIVEQ